MARRQNNWGSLTIAVYSPRPENFARRPRCDAQDSLGRFRHGTRGTAPPAQALPLVPIVAGKGTSPLGPFVRRRLGHLPLSCGQQSVAGRPATGGPSRSEGYGVVQGIWQIRRTTPGCTGTRHPKTREVLSPSTARSLRRVSPSGPRVHHARPRGAVGAVLGGWGSWRCGCSSDPGTGEDPPPRTSFPPAGSAREWVVKTFMGLLRF